MQLSSKDAVQMAAQQMRTGRWSEGESLCRQVLAAEPNHAGALHLLGVSAGTSGRTDEAIELIGKAIKSNPNVAEYHANLSKFLGDRSRYEEAIAAARRAVQLQPKFAMAWNNLGEAQRRSGRISESATAFVQAANCQPDCAEFQKSAGAALLEIGRVEEAVACLRRWVQLAPAELTANAWYDLGVGLMADMRYDEAIDANRRCLAINPRHEAAWNNLGNALKRTGRLDEAADALGESLRLKPDWGEAWCNLGGVYMAQGRIESANDAFHEALLKAPQQPVIHYNHGVLLLLQGDFERGWQEYEWRWKCREVKIPTRFPVPPWRGEPLDGKTIMLHGEQGLGDSIQFIRYAPMVAARGGKIILCVQPEVCRLLKDVPGVERVAPQPNELPACHTYCYLMDLPLAFGTRMDSIPNATPYLTADPQLCRRWGGRLAQDADLKVGLAWAGRPTHVNDRWRTLNLSQLAPLSEVPGVTFYSLQKGAGSEQAGAGPTGMKLVDLTAEMDDFADTAALASNLDLIVTVDSAVAHLAGAIGKPVWILTPFAPDWRWMLKCQDSPWYPTARLFRQPAQGDWATVVQRIRQELTALAGKRSPVPSPGTPGEG
jgi:tetratricopeptide (TPR) repeat protein